MRYINGDDSYTVIFDRDKMHNLLKEVKENTKLVRRVFRMEEKDYNVDKLYQDMTLSSIKIDIKNDGKFISYNKDFESNLYHHIYGLLSSDEASIYDLVELKELFDRKENLTSDEEKEKYYLDKALKLIKFEKEIKRSK